MEPYIVETCAAEDLPVIYRLFESALEYQRRKGFPVWKGFDRQTPIADIAADLQFKMVQGTDIAIIFSICYTDPFVWGEKDGSALYLHRIVVNPLFKGRRLFGRILEWAVRRAKHDGLSTIRMDTWADNPNIIAYYQSFGFRFIGNHTTSDRPELPVQNRNLAVALLEYAL